MKRSNLAAGTDSCGIQSSLYPDTCHSFYSEKILTLFVICGQLSPDCFGQIVTL